MLRTSDGDDGDDGDIEMVDAPPVHFSGPSPSTFIHFCSDYQTKPKKNIFDDLPALRAPTKSVAVADELWLYLSSPPEHVKDPIRWWYEKRLLFPRLHHMALDYLCIPGVYSISFA